MGCGNPPSAAERCMGPPHDVAILARTGGVCRQQGPWTGPDLSREASQDGWLPFLNLPFFDLWVGLPFPEGAWLLVLSI